MLLAKYLTEKATLRPNVLGLLQKLEQKAESSHNMWDLKKIRKAIPLFDEHNFWYTQPVPKYYEMYPETAFNKAIEVKTVADVQQEGYALPSGYEWCSVDLANDEQAEELYQLLTNHYVEDSEGKFRFDYSIDFIRWALMPPNHYPDWVVGVRGNGKLNGFISAIPVTMVVNG